MVLSLSRYKKFLRSKDLSVQREEDLECVLGTKKRKQVASGGKVSLFHC